MNSQLSDLARVEYGKSPNEVRDDNGIYAIYGTSGLVGFANQKLFDQDGVIVARKGTLDNPTFVQGEYWVIDTAFAALPKEQVDPKWLYYSLANFDLSKLNEATGVPSISRDYLYRTKFYTPEYAVQKKIAKILTTVDNLIEKTQSLIDKYTAIKQGMMTDLFTRGIDLSGTPDTNPNYGQLRPSFEQAPEIYKETELGWVPKEWEVSKFEVLLDGIDAGKSPDCPDIVPDSGEWGVIKVSAVNPEDFKAFESKLIVEEAYKNRLYQIVQGDLLITRANTPELVGMVCFVDEVPDKLLLSDKTLRLNIKSIYSSKYFFWQLQQPYIRCQIEIGASGTSGSMKNIGQVVIRNFDVLLPDLNEQTAVAKRLDAVQAKLQSFKKNRDKFCLIKKGLMQDLLTGKVKVS